MLVLAVTTSAPVMLAGSARVAPISESPALFSSPACTRASASPGMFRGLVHCTKQWNYVL